MVAGNGHLYAARAGTGAVGLAVVRATVEGVREWRGRSQTSNGRTYVTNVEPEKIQEAVNDQDVIPLTALDDLADLADRLFRPVAERVDQDGFYPTDALRGMVRASFRGLDSNDNGPAKLDLMSPVLAIRATARACGASAFCLWCQAALAWYVEQTENTDIKARYQEAVVSGLVLGGTGLSNPMKSVSGLERLGLRGQLESGGYRVIGVVPWVSNIEAGHPFGFVFQTEDGPMMALTSDATDGVTIKPSMPFVVMEGTATVSVRFRNVLIAKDAVLAVNASEFLLQIRPGFVLFQMGLGLGLMDEAASLIETSKRDVGGQAVSRLVRTPDDIRRRAKILTHCVKTLAHSIEAGARPEPNDVFGLRLELAERAYEAVIAAQIHLGAKGLLVGARVQRLLREAAFFGVLTPTVRHLDYELASRTKNNE